MSYFNQRQVVSMLVMLAGLAGCAAQQTATACPPEEGGSPDPAQIERQIIVRTLPGVTLSSQPEIVQERWVRSEPASTNRLVALARQPGSTLETRVYKPGEATSLYRLGATSDGVERVLRVKEDGRDIRVEQRGGKIKATINGKEVPADAVTVKGGTIEVRDADGKTVLTEEWPEIDVKVRTLGGTPALSGTRTLPGVTWMQQPEELPQVMLGITMESADEDTVEQLGLPEGDYAIISSVPEGLPAAKAGVQPRDIVVSVDGKTPASSDAIREVMSQKKPGDVLKVEVARKGNRVKMDIPLEAFDSNRFRAYAQTMSQDSKVWEKYAKEMDEKAREMSRAFQSTVDAEKLHRDLLAIPRDGKNGPMILTTPGEGTLRLNERLSALEAQLQRLEAMLKRFEATSAVPPVPPVPPIAPVPPVPPVPPSGGGGSPAPWYAVGV